MCCSPSGADYSIDVKGLASKIEFPIQKDRTTGKAIASLFFVFVYVAPPGKSLEFFLMSHQEVIENHSKIRAVMEAADKTYKEFPWGFRYHQLQSFKDRWQNLPV